MVYTDKTGKRFGRFTAVWAVLSAASVLLGSCPALFQEKVAMPAVRATGSLGELLITEEKPEITGLPPPSQVFVEDRQSAVRIKVSWTPVAGALYYHIDRAAMEKGLDGAYPEPKEENFDFLARVYSPSYTDYVLDDPQRDSPEYEQRFYYRISTGSVEWEPSESSAPLWGSLLPPVRGVKASLGTREGMVEIVWNQVDKAAAYEIYRADSESSVMEYRGRRLGSQNMFQNRINDATEAGKELYYWVYALASSGEKSVRSNSAMGYSQITGSPSMPGNLKLQSGYSLGASASEIKLAWDPSSAGGEIKYVVFRYSQDDDTLVRLTPQPAGSLEGTADTFWVDSGDLNAGIYYYYLVQALTMDGSKILKSGMDRDMAFRAFVLSPPSSMEALKVSSTVTIRWKAAINDDAAPVSYSYEIEGAPAQNGPWTVVDTVSVFSVDADGIITKTGVLPSPFYRIVTVNGSVKSNPGAVFAPAPDPAVMVDVSRSRYLSDVVPNSRGVYPVVINWKKPDADNPAAYRLYRSESRDSGFRPVTETPIPASTGSGGQFTFTDINSSARPGKYYYYRVLSLNEMGQGSFYSETRAGYGALTPETFFGEFIATMNNSLNKLINMNKAGAMDKLGDENKHGSAGGTVFYDTPDSLVSAIPPFTIYIRYENYADYYIENNIALGPYIVLNGNSDTRVDSTSGNGQMQGTITVSGMYGGTVNYDNIVIKGQAAAGGYYLVSPNGLSSTAQIDWTKGKR
jgi:hypothetical protein